MSQIDQFLESLKRSLKSKNITYKDLGAKLDLSESSVKRILSNKSLGLDRLEEICSLTDISFADICKNAQFNSDEEFYNLSFEQEKVLAQNPRLIHLLMLLHEGKSAAKIEKEYEISSIELKKLLLILDKQKIIELHPGDRVKINKIGKLRFRRDGEVGKVMFNQTKNSYLNYDFDNKNDYIRFTHIFLSPALTNKLKSKLEKLLMEFQEEAHYVDESADNTQELGVLFSFRPWTGVFTNEIKKRKLK